jgi:hypothetical protein
VVAPDVAVEHADDRRFGRAGPNGVRQQAGTDYTVDGDTLVFRQELRKDRISKWRWFVGAWGVGTYRQDDSVDVRYERPDGTPAVAEKLDIELRP